MARRSRDDAPGAWFHVMNRGIARRTLFELWRDKELFLEHLGAACERGEIEVHAYTLMSTHFHMLVRSLEGRLADAMQRVQTEYSRWFNRGRMRDGPLVRGRYMAKRVDSLAYQRAVVSYIDGNPVAAGIVSSASEYTYGSANIYAGAGAGCPWLTRAWVESEVCGALGISSYDPARYGEVFGPLPVGVARVIEARWRSSVRKDPLDDLIRAAPAAVVAWMKEKAERADGIRPGLPVLDPASVADATRDLSLHDGDWRVGRRSGWFVLEVGLARQVCGLTLEEVGGRHDVSSATVRSLAGLHLRLLGSDSEYAERAGAVVRRALRVWEPIKK